MPKSSSASWPHTLEYKAVIQYTLMFILVVLPFYNWFYRNAINILYIGAFLISVPVILFTFLRYLLKKNLQDAFISMIFLIFVLGTGFYAQDWRYDITDFVIKSFYCDLDRPLGSEIVLGGIREMTFAGFPGRLGSFENTSHCLIVVCSEEIFYCDNAKMEVYR